MSRGLVIAAPKSGAGKTTFTLGLMRALRRRGMGVAGRKSGPDYIDPAFHAAACGKPSHNLDTWAMSAALIGALAPSASDVVLIEGSMGLFDGVPAPPLKSGASADVAALLELPVLLVVDVAGQAQSAAAVVQGFCHYRPDVRIAGVVLNRVASERHRLLASLGIEKLGVPIVGVLPPQPSMQLPERHLGLVQAGETADLEARLTALADFVEAHCDVAAIMALAAPFAEAPFTSAMRPPAQRIALSEDAAFSFLYPHLLAAWRQGGAEIVPFSPLNDEAPAMDADFCWLCGGYPELHAGRLAGNSTFLDGLRRFAATKPVHGECGGYMVLGTGLTDALGQRHAMAGLLGHETSFHKRKMTLGYRKAVLAESCGLGAKGMTFRGHEFHYSTLSAAGDDAPFVLVSDAYGDEAKPAGGCRGHVSGSYLHLIAAES